MHKHLLCFKQWPVQRRWLWCCSSASASAVHLLQHLLCLLLLIVLRNLHVLVERRLLHWQQQLQCLHFLFLRLLQHWVPAVLRLLLLIWQQRQQRPMRGRRPWFGVHRLPYGHRLQRLRPTHDCTPITKLHAGHRLCRLRAAPGASAATATFSTSTFTFSTATSAATATTATAATAALAKPTSAPTSAIASVAPLDDIQLHQYVRVCLRRLLSRWWARLAVVVLLFRHRLLRLPPTCSVSAAVATVAAVDAAAAAALPSASAAISITATLVISATTYATAAVPISSAT